RAARNRILEGRQPGKLGRRRRRLGDVRRTGNAAWALRRFCDITARRCQIVRVIAGRLYGRFFLGVRSGRPGYRLRVGDWRVIYELDETVRILGVENVVPRGGAYR